MMPVWAAGQLFWQSESALHLGAQTPPPSGWPDPVVLLPVVSLPVVLLPVPPLPPAPVVTVLSGVPDVAAEPPVSNGVVSVPDAQAAMRPPVARTRASTLRLAYFTGL